MGRMEERSRAGPGHWGDRELREAGGPVKETDREGAAPGGL